MNFLTWIKRSLYFHRRMHLAMAGGAALATAVLAAALLTGDALNRNLRRMALERVGGIQSAVELRGRFMDATLADRLATETGAPVAPVLKLPATVLAVADNGEETRVDRVNAIGVDGRFFALGGSGRAGRLPLRSPCASSNLPRFRVKCRWATGMAIVWSGVRCSCAACCRTRNWDALR